MTPEQYQIIKGLFYAALELPADERQTFLRAECQGDSGLLAEVNALIAANEQPGDFLDAPAYEVAAGLLLETTTGALVGQRFGPYQILSLLGIGGMGEVYLAEDTRLGRRVALKFLPDYLTVDPSRVRRFKQEARAASALNHPNLITIYEIEAIDGRYYIAMEFVEGETLRQLIKGGRLELAEIIRIASKVAGALAKAHQAGIVHRDIKPENIMVDVDGRVKVLDFGLAKYTQPDPETPSTGSLTNQTKTVPGAVMGTSAYMSPEQARGLAVDPRTDIWSLGVVIFEMIAGQPPFTGPTNADVLVAILQQETPVLEATRFPISVELQRIVQRTLAKDSELRFRTAQELFSQLEPLRYKADHSAIDLPLAALAAPTSERKVPSRTRIWTDRSLLFKLGFVALLVLVTAAGVWSWRALRANSGTPPLAPPTNRLPERNLSYWIEVQKYREGKPFQDPFRLGREINFEKDYRIRLNLRPSADGHLYLFSEGPGASGQPSPLVILFPSSTTNDGQSALAAGHNVQIPERTWLEFDAQEGTEKVWLVYSREPIAMLEALKSFANPRDRGLIGDPAQSGAVRSFFNSHQNPLPVATPDEVNQQMVVRSDNDILVYLLRLEHH
jgi:serine/threonine protein kinase